MSKVEAYVCNICTVTLPLYHLFEIIFIPCGKLDKHVCLKCMPPFMAAFRTVGMSAGVVNKLLDRGHEGHPGLITVSSIGWDSATGNDKTVNST